MALSAYLVVVFSATVVATFQRFQNTNRWRCLKLIWWKLYKRVPIQLIMLYAVAWFLSDLLHYAFCVTNKSESDRSAVRWLAENKCIQVQRICLTRCILWHYGILGCITRLRCRRPEFRPLHLGLKVIAARTALLSVLYTSLILSTPVFCLP